MSQDYLFQVKECLSFVTFYKFHWVIVSGMKTMSCKLAGTVGKFKFLFLLIIAFNSLNAQIQMDSIYLDDNNYKLFQTILNFQKCGIKEFNVLNQDGWFIKNDEIIKTDTILNELAEISKDVKPYKIDIYKLEVGYISKIIIHYKFLNRPQINKIDFYVRISSFDVTSKKDEKLFSVLY